MSGFQPVAGGGAASAEDAARARAVLAAAATELDSLRGSAAKWQAGLVALAGGITAFGLIVREVPGTRVCGATGGLQLTVPSSG